MNWIPSLVAAVVALLGVFGQPVQDFITSHPAIVAVLAGLGTIIASLLRSPIQPPR